MDDHEQRELEQDFPPWTFWRGQRADGSPGDLMATRREPLTTAQITAGLANTLPAGISNDLRAQLAEQAALEGRLA